MTPHEVLVKARELTAEQIADIKSVANGCDVFDYGLARRLRLIERKNPGLLKIGPSPCEYGVRERHPYFGAMATKAGRRAIALAQEGV